MTHLNSDTVFMSGPPGAGKTTLAVQRLRRLWEQGVPPGEILIFMPQRTLAWPYYDAMREAGIESRVATLAGLAQQWIAEFWLEVAEQAGFAHPDRPPTFLSFETTQFVLDQIVGPFVEGGAFEGVTVSRTRLLAQLIDNLDRSAGVGFPLDELAARLSSAWAGESSRNQVFESVQEVALAFRRTCLEQNLLDWSLQIDVFWQHVLALSAARERLFGTYRHLIVDNSEEHTPVAHDLLRLWLPACESALIVHDTGGGYRVLLAADPAGSLALADLCREKVTLTHSHVAAPAAGALGVELAGLLGERARWQDGHANPLAAFHFETRRYYPEMLDWVAEQVSRLVMEQGVPPEDIAVLAPFPTDVLEFSLTEKLAPFGIPLSAHRPARALSGEPAVECLLTLAKLAHREWQRPPSSDEVAHALSKAIVDLDPVRARLLTDIVYRVNGDEPSLLPFHHLVPDTQERISLLLGRRYDDLGQWLQDYTSGDGSRRGGNAGANGYGGLDVFVTRLVDEVLSHAGFGFYEDKDALLAAQNLAESIRRFDHAVSPLLSPAEPDAGGGKANGAESPALAYVDRVERGLVAGQYLASWQPGAHQGVLLASPVTFLLMNQPVAVQFWLDIGSRGWFERTYQPISQPYVLSRDWPEGQVWTDADEVQARNKSLAQLILGLTYRCRQHVYLAFSELNVQGYEQRGPLLQTVQQLLQRHA